MEQSCRVFGNDGAADSSTLYALKSSEKIVKRVSKQLACPNVAGFQARLDREDFQALLKHVSSEKIEVLLDEFMVQVRSNPHSFSVLLCSISLSLLSCRDHRLLGGKFLVAIQRNAQAPLLAQAGPIPPLCSIFSGRKLLF